MICASPSKFTLYYSTLDDWTPGHHEEMSSHVNERVGKEEKGRVFATHTIPHAFPLDHSEEMAQVMSKWIKKVY
jgi:hypothetical protein